MTTDTIEEPRERENSPDKKDSSLTGENISSQDILEKIENQAKTIESRIKSSEENIKQQLSIMWTLVVGGFFIIVLMVAAMFMDALWSNNDMTKILLEECRHRNQNTGFINQETE